MSCIKTGAKVYFVNYGMLVPADIYSIGTCFVIRWNVQGRMYIPESDTEWTHKVHQVSNSAEWWHRDDIGVTVVPAGFVEWLQND